MKFKILFILILCLFDKKKVLATPLTGGLPGRFLSKYVYELRYEIQKTEAVLDSFFKKKVKLGLKKSFYQVKKTKFTNNKIIFFTENNTKTEQFLDDFSNKKAILWDRIIIVTPSFHIRFQEQSDLDFFRDKISKLKRLHLLKDTSLRKKIELLKTDKKEDFLDLKKKFSKLINIFYQNYGPKKSSDRLFLDTELFYFSDCFLSLIYKNIELIETLPVETLVDILKKIILDQIHNPRIESVLIKILTEKADSLFLYLRNKNNKNGNNLVSYARKNYIKKSDFFKTIRIENDIIWLSMIRNVFADNLTYSSEKFINNNYNFEDLIHVGQLKICIAFYLYKKSHPQAWKRTVDEALDEINYQRNILEKRDFSAPYGRWGQAGSLLSELVKLEEKQNMKYYQLVKNVVVDCFSSEDYLKTIRKISLFKINDAYIAEYLHSILL